MCTSEVRILRRSRTLEPKTRVRPSKESKNLAEIQLLAQVTEVPCIAMPESASFSTVSGASNATQRMWVPRAGEMMQMRYAARCKLLIKLLPAQPPQGQRIPKRLSKINEKLFPWVLYIGIHIGFGV